MTFSRYTQDLKDVGIFVWNGLLSLEVLSLILFVFGGYLLFGVFLFHKKHKNRNWKVELILILVSLICVERWFWIAEGERLLREGKDAKYIGEQNLWLLIPALIWYFSLYMTRLKNTYFKILAILIGIVGLFYLFLVNAFYFIGTP